MTTISIPDNWHKFILERDNYREVWMAWAIVDDYWYKGLGKSQALAYLELTDNILIGKHVAKLEPARYAPASGGKAYRQATTPPEVFADIDLSSFDLDL